MDDIERPLSVSELTALVKEILEGSLPSVLVEGEISNCRPASSGHLYFTLKDRGAMLQAVMFRYRSRRWASSPRTASWCGREAACRSMPPAANTS